MTANPGLQNQSAIRAVARVLCFVFLAGAVYCAYVGLHAMFTDPFAEGAKPWMFGIALLLFFLAGVSSQIGFLGAASRFVAGETVPVAKDSLEYLTDGQGLANLGKAASTKAGPYCRECGTRGDVEAKFCDSCGAALV